MNLNVTRPNQVKYGDRSLRVVGPKMWNYPLSHITSTARKESKYGVFSGPYFSVFSSNGGKYGPEKIPYLDTFHAVSTPNLLFFKHLIKRWDGVSCECNLFKKL